VLIKNDAQKKAMINPAMASLASFSPLKSDNYDPNWENL
jgi:hypothetical protein